MIFPAALLLLSAAFVHALKPYSNVTVWSPPASYIVPRTLYARTVMIEHDGRDDNVLLATWENYSPDVPPLAWFPIFRSTDLGKSWRPISNVTDTENGWGLRYQPFLYEMTESIGSYPKGTILAAGNSIPFNLSNTQIDLYASRDKGYSWKFVSHIAAGGEALPNNGLTPVWEPFLMTYNHELVVYYSDQRDPLYGQKLVHQASRDLKTWGDVVDDTAYPTYDWRPGMPTISHLPNGMYIYTYEFYGAVEGAFAVYYRLSRSPLTFDSAEGLVITAKTGEQPVGSPYNVWTPYGGKNGTIVVTAGSHTGLFLNKALAAPGSEWTYLETPAAAAYSRSIRVMPSANQILISGGGILGGTENSVTVTVVDLP